MVDFAHPNSFQLNALHEALLFAYPTPQLLSMFMLLKLGKNYDEIAPYGQPYDTALSHVLMRAKGDGWLSELVMKALQDKPRSPKLVVLKRTFELTSAEFPEELNLSLEDIVRTEGGYEELIPWAKNLGGLARKICRIEYPVGQARGTGWLVGPDLLLTNWHVINQALTGGVWSAPELACRFDYAVTSQGTLEGRIVKLARNWCLDWSPASPSELGTGQDKPSEETLDYALLCLEQSIGNEVAADGEVRGWIETNKNQKPPVQGEIVLVVQHPGGNPVKLAPGAVLGNSDNNLRVFHNANTEGGSSGSPVVNFKLEPVALHHAGDVLYHQGRIGKPEKNQAVPISTIIQRLDRQNVKRIWKE